ncbi:MAG: NADH-quinone oxidoreductase subunit C [Methylococcales bacterium]|jgi:NADH-quinone oxidoreductase subunit C|nr:NADH-quinone oxidoreductase subunit C [Methylococcales bacterium]MBT7410779.1 NADH-quinone oxidoreductase subunit C [Methylococcales bacterium]
MKSLINRLTEQFKVSLEKQTKSDLCFIRVNKDDAEQLIRHCRDHESYTHLSFLTAIDRIEDNKFTLTYLLHNYQSHQSLGVHVELDRENPVMHSLHRLWGQMATYQRELKEIYGIEFPGSPRLNDEFFLEGWDQIPPMRKEFSTVEFCEERFPIREGRQSTDAKQTMKVEIYPGRGE